MKKHLLTCMFAAPLLLFAQQTYTWNVTSGSWMDPLSWSPQRITPASDDIIEFASNASVTDMPPTENIGKLRLSNSATVSFSATAGSTIAIGHSTISAPHCIVEPGASLYIAGGNPIALNIGNGYTGEIYDNIDFSGGAHRLTASSVGGLLFKNAAVFTANTGFAGNAFGTTNLNSVLFESGARYNNKSGGNPFGATAPASVIVLQSGSIYDHQRATAMSISGRTYGNIYINGNTSYNLSLNLDAIVQNNIEVYDFNFSFNPSGGAGVFKIRGDIVINGTGNLTLGTAATINHIELSGVNQNIGNGTGPGSLVFQNLSINNTSTTLNRNITVNGVLNMQNGKIISATNKLLTLSATASIQTCMHDYSQLPYLNLGCDNAYIDGPVQKLGLNSMNFAFPVGAGGKLRPVVLRNATGDFVVEYIKSDPYIDIGNTMGNGIHHISHLEYWNIGGTGTANLELTYYDPNSGGVTDMNALRVAGYTGSQWNDMSVTGFLGNPGSNGSITSAALTAFGNFALAGSSAYPNNPLPLKLMEWKARPDNSKILLQWESVDEANIKGYIVERGINGEFKELLPLVPAQKSLRSSYYTYDNQPIIGSSQYRLKIIDFDGRVEYSKIIEIFIPFQADLSVYPNPASEKIFIKISPSSSISALALVNISGSVVKCVNTKNLTIVSVDLLNLSPGLYYLKTIQGQSTQVVPFIKYNK